MFGPSVVVNAMFGLHEYVVAPLAVKLIELFKQINAGFGLIVTVGFAVVFGPSVVVNAMFGLHV